MLVLTRGVEEVIVVGDSIRIKILRVKGQKVRIGIEAPDDIVIRREEIPKRRKSKDEESI